MEERYDYIIVGAGSAGSVVANRLSADPGTTVLLIESGPDHNDFMVDMPRGVGVINNLGSKFNWSYPDALTGENRPPERWFKGRGLGGSSSVNGMVYMRGSPRDDLARKALQRSSRIPGPGPGPNEPSYRDRDDSLEDPDRRRQSLWSRAAEQARDPHRGG